MTDKQSREPADNGTGHLSRTAQEELLSAARRSLSLALGRPGASDAADPPTSPEVTERSGGAFVTLKQRGRLRGCIGHLMDDRPLHETVEDMVVQAALHDPRFSPLAPEELDGVDLEISVLTPFRPVSGPKDIVAGRDGVLIQKDGRRAVFLPQVATEQGWNVSTMLEHLCHKAGLPADAWRKPGMEFQIFQAQVFGESEE